MPINEVNEDVMWLIAGCVEFLCVDLFRVSDVIISSKFSRKCSLSNWRHFLFRRH